MGAIQSPPLSQLAVALARELGLGDFVETGTYLGGSLRWAAATFDRVWTIEINPEFQARAQASHADLSNIVYNLGDSAVVLKSIMERLRGPAFVWLDAHAGGGHFAEQDICPLLQELAVVLESPHEHCVVIDDARAFVAPPPAPFDAEQWPSLDRMFATVPALSRRNVVIIHDAIIVVPQRARGVVTEFCRLTRPTI